MELAIQSEYPKNLPHAAAIENLPDHLPGNTAKRGRWGPLRSRHDSGAPRPAIRI